MNKDRRKTLLKIIHQLEEVKTLLESLKDDVSQCQEEEQDYYDNMPESLQNGDKGERASEAIEKMTEAVDNLESLDDTLEEAISALQEAAT